ncbi:MAG: hypothetical protein SF339_02535 [Blastocatellia bacterium]|nr:hypothetical protein [Blastocatellia bacterium]
MRLFSLVLLLGLLVVPASAQLARNPKIGAEDLAAAQAETSLAGGASAELIYAARLDAVQKGAFDCLIVIYSKSIKNGKDFFAVILRGEKKHPLALDKAGRALKAGDKFLRMGLRHEEGKPPLLRLIASATDPVKGEQQRNLDYRFNGAEFALETQSLVPPAK